MYLWGFVVLIVFICIVKMISTGRSREQRLDDLEARLRKRLGGE